MCTDELGRRVDPQFEASLLLLLTLSLYPPLPSEASEKGVCGSGVSGPNSAP